jgi:nitroreductase
MDTFLTVVSRREVREYAARALPEEGVRRILEAGRLAGSSRNRQARRFLVLRDRSLVERAAEAVYVPRNLLGAALVVAVIVYGKGRRHRLVPERHRRPRANAPPPGPSGRGTGRHRSLVRLSAASSLARAPHAAGVDRARRPAAVRGRRGGALSRDDPAGLDRRAAATHSRTASLRCAVPRVDYVDEGAGPALMLHGNPTSSRRR